jgi:hypothetical protein
MVQLVACERTSTRIAAATAQKVTYQPLAFIHINVEGFVFEVEVAVAL